MIDLKDEFTLIGKRFVAELNRNIRTQVDIAKKQFAYIRPKTAWLRAEESGRLKGARKKGGDNNHSVFALADIRLTKKLKAAKSSIDKDSSYPPGIVKTRMMFTSRFRQEAFKYESDGMGVAVRTNSNIYPDTNPKRKRLSYDKIVRYNNVGDPETNQRVAPQNRPLLFPKNNSEVAMMEAVKFAGEILNSPVVQKKVMRQIQASALDNFTRKINVML